MFGKVHAALGDANPFTLQQALLERGMRFAEEDPATCANHAVPGNPLTRRACRHGTSGGARSSTQCEQLPELPIS